MPTVSAALPSTTSKRRRAPLALGSNSPSPPPEPRKRIKQSPAPFLFEREPSLEPDTAGLGAKGKLEDGRGRSSSPIKRIPEEKEKEEEEEEEDYMSLALPSDPPPRKTRHPPANLKSKAELAAQAAKARDLGLQRNLLEENGGKSKGMKLLKAMGYVPGQGLGKEGKGVVEPIGVKLRRKEDKSGVGDAKEEKREWYDDEKKLREVDVEDYRKAVRGEKELRRMEGMFWGALGIWEQLCEKEERQEKDDVYLKVLRKDRAEKEAAKAKMRDATTRELTLREEYARQVVEEDGDEEEPEDPELSGFMEKDAGERLDELVEALSKQFNYCFWCKYQYEDESMDGCPGGGEDGHG